MKKLTLIKAVAVVALTILIVRGQSVLSPPAGSDAPVNRTPGRTLRVAAIGGINDQDFWTGLVARFEKTTNIKVETVATGNKGGAADLFRRGGIDLITMQSSEAVIGLAAAGLVTDVRPWVQADLALVGPASDPANVKGAANLADALRRIAASRSPFVVHDSHGAQDVLIAVSQKDGIEFPSATTTFLLDDHQRRVLTIASERKAYTLIGRVPFLSGKLQRGGLEVMLSGDERLRRPYVLAIANPNRFPKAHVAEAQQFATYLLSPETQTWIAQFGRGKFDNRSLFDPVSD